MGSSFASLPAWASAWAKVDPSLLSIVDINKDGIVQLAEIVIGGDLIVLATPEIAGLPYVVSGLVAAGGLAAALSTADGLLLTIANAMAHDLYYKMINPTATTGRRVFLSKFLLVCAAITAAYVTSLKPGDILFLVGAAFSLGASSFFPSLVMGIFWKRANKWGAIVGMAAGLGICVYYMVRTLPVLRHQDVPRCVVRAEPGIGGHVRPAGGRCSRSIIVSLLTTPNHRRRCRSWSSTCATRTWWATRWSAKPDSLGPADSDKARFGGLCFCEAVFLCRETGDESILGCR